MKPLIFAFVLVAAIAPKHVSASPQRQALVIGNDSYPGNSLKNARNDAQAISEALGSIGYVTMLQLDVTRKVLNDSVDIFAGGLNPGDTAVLYYSGHGLQVDGENYLVPTDFQVTSPSDVKYQGYPLSLVLEKFARRGATTQIIILDACRDNPFLGTRSSRGGGWAGVGNSAGTFLAFGTAPGSTASDNPTKPNGLFTEALLKYVTSSQLGIEAMFEKVREDVIRESNGLQVPWTASSLVGSFHILPKIDANPNVSLASNQGAPISVAAARSIATQTATGGQTDISNSLPILINEGLLLAQQQNYEEAIRSLSAATAINPTSSIALRVLGLIFHLMGRSTEAVAEFDRALTVNPGDASAYYYRCLATAPSDAVSAVRDCQAAIGLEPNFPEAHLGLANALLVLGQTDRAHAEANASIHLAPASSLGYSMRGKISAIEGHYNSAQRDYDSAVSLSSPDPER